MDPVDPALQPVIVLRVVIRSPDLETFVSKYSQFIKDDRIFIYALKDIKKGEEITYDYNLQVEEDDEDPYTCLCGTKKCRGTMLAS